MNYISTVVLIEDSVTQAQQIAAFMSNFDISVYIATDVRQGLRLIDVYHPSVVVMDLYMPILNGFQLCSRLKRDPTTADIPVVMVTSSDRQQDALTSARVGVDKYIVKDSDLAENLLEALQELETELSDNNAIT